MTPLDETPAPAAPPARKRRHRKSPEAATAAGVVQGQTRIAFAEIRRVLERHVAKRLQGLGAEPGSPTIANAVREVGIELEALFVTIGHIIARATQEIKGDNTSLSRRTVNAAFRLLNLEPPRAGQAIDMRRVLKQKQRVARLYHPDAHGGDRTTEPQYYAAIEAYATIQAYVRQQKSLSGVATATQPETQPDTQPDTKGDER